MIRYIMFLLLVAFVFGAISKWMIIPFLIAQRKEQATYNKIVGKIYIKK